MIQEMKEMVKERLQAYKAKNKERYPDNIMYYRDGVSDSQYASVKRDELTAIRDAYAEETKSNKTVKITAIVTAKRHHTRLYPHQGKNSVKTTGTTGNVVPGTTVDSTITSPIWFDFFIVTHNGIQGTSRPTHYFVLENQMEFNADQLQNFVSHYPLHPSYSLARPANFMTSADKQALLHLRPLHLGRLVRAASVLRRSSVRTRPHLLETLLRRYF